MLISRRQFVKGAAVSAVTFAHGSVNVLASEASLPNPIFAYEFGNITAAQQANFARDFGFAGTVFDHPVDIAERLRAMDEARMQLFFLWFTVDVSGGQIKYEPGMEAAIAALQGRGTVVWVALQGGGDGAEERAIEAVRHISDLAAQANLRVAVYPHYKFYLARFRDVVRVTEAVGRSNVGSTFNLCHELRSGWDPEFPQLLQKAMPRLYAVTINGANQKGEDWDTLIQPLGRGDYDVSALVHTFVKAGYRGPFGIQCYGLKGDPGVYLKQSMTAWRSIVGS
jgi:sugar phosphate isomerase/epimerase